MAVIETWYNQDLKNPVKVHYLDGNVFSQDNKGNLIGVRVFDDGEPSTLSGSVSASVVRADGATVAVAGVLSGNAAWVTLPESCYYIPGVLSIVIKVTDGSTVTTVCAVVANVYQSSTDSIVDPGTIIPSVSALIAEIDAAIAQIPADYSDLSNAVGHIEDDFLTDDNISFMSLANDDTYLDNTNTEQENTAVSVTDYIRIPRDVWAIDISTKTVLSGNQVYILPLLFFYDANKNYISHVYSQSESVARFEIPQNAAFIRANQPSSSISSSVPRIIRFVFGSMGYRLSLTSSDDLNTLTRPGVFWFAYNDKPSNTPSEVTTSGRVLVIRSEDPSNFGAEWQLVCTTDGLFYRSSPNTDGSYWTPWEHVQRKKSAMSFKMQLTSADDMRAIAENGMYQYDTSSIPADAPSKIGGRPIIIKSTSDDSHYCEAQLQIIDGVLYYRSTPDNSSVLLPWKSVGLGSPMYQTETLPYNAVLYHQKWEGWGGPGRARSEKTILLGYVDNDETLPIYAYELSMARNYIGEDEHHVDYDFTNPPYARPKIMIIGGVHGNEKCTPMDIWTIAQALKSRDYNDIACMFDWYFVPLVNPWGYSHAHLDANGDIVYDNGEYTQTVACTAEINAGIRMNGHGMNINRDWSDNTYVLLSDGHTYGFQTPELQLVFPYVLSVNPDVFIDAHQNHANRQLSTDPMCCYVRPYFSEPATEDTLKLLRRTDIANANVDQIMYRYCKNTRTMHNVCRFSTMLSPQYNYLTSNMYMAGLSILQGSVRCGNTAHPELAAKYSVLTETSEICYSYNGGYDIWYTPWACTFSCTYLWEMLRQIAGLF